MPNHETHIAVTTALLGSDISERFKWVHSALDSSASKTGPTHRGDFVHTEDYIRMIAPMHYDKMRDEPYFQVYLDRALSVARLHLLTDKLGISYRDSEAATAVVRQIMNGGIAPGEMQELYFRAKHHENQQRGQQQQRKTIIRSAHTLERNVNRLFRAFLK